MYIFLIIWNYLPDYRKMRKGARMRSNVNIYVEIVYSVHCTLQCTYIVVYINQFKLSYFLIKVLWNQEISLANKKKENATNDY